MAPTCAIGASRLKTVPPNAPRPRSIRPPGDSAIRDPIIAAEFTAGLHALHDGKHFAFEGKTPASRALRYEIVFFPEIKNRELAQRHKVTERAVKKQRCLLRSRLSAMAKLREVKEMRSREVKMLSRDAQMLRSLA